jgi:hypothetical protein
MPEVHFRVDGLTEENVRRWRKRIRPTAVTAKVVGWSAAAVVIVYAINYPGQIKVTPAGGGTSTTSSVITVKGTVENTNVGAITLNVNGYPWTVSVENGAFNFRIPLNPGENTIQASVGGVASEIIKIRADLGRLTGECSGTIGVSPRSGYEQDPHIATISISPPYVRVITRVTTNNPRCKECDAKQTRTGQFSLTLHFEGRGSYRIEFLAFDKHGKIRCRGYSTELMALGSRQQ